MYYGEFKCKEDICKEFCISEDFGTVLFACYDQDSYDGHAEVIFVRAGKIYMVSGSHCSCYGLEDSWNPIEMPFEGLEQIVESSGMLSRYGGLANAVKSLVKMNIEGASSEVRSVLIKMAFS